MGNIKWSVGQFTDSELIKAFTASKAELATLKKGTPAYDSCMNEMDEYAYEMQERIESRGRQQRYLRGIWQSTTEGDR